MSAPRVLARVIGALILLVILVAVLLPNHNLAWMREHWSWFNRPMLWIEDTGGPVNLVHLALFVLFGWLWGASAAGMAWAAKAFVPAWLVMSAANMWVGVSHAGYSVREEFPILLGVFAVPAVLAALAIWWLGKA